MASDLAEREDSNIEPTGTTNSATEAETSTHTPRTHVDSKPLPTDSLVTINLSETGRSSTSTAYRESSILSAPEADLDDTPKQQQASGDMLNGLADQVEAAEMPRGSVASDTYQVVEWARPRMSTERGESFSDGSDRSIEVDWDELDKTEEREDADADSDEASTLLLARLEQENNAIASDPKSGHNRSRTQSRPPSVYQLRKIAQEQGPRSVRFSLLPAAAPMTELDLWAALVQDYRNTAQRLPTLTSNKIRAGIPAPLRGVVWVSMAGARDVVIEEQFDKLSSESSPYETIINKDIGRSFPGVAMFRDPEGDGQKMLARVLKCYSLYDKEIGYCQGLGFLVGPLLMNMGDKQAFCVLVRLMEDYDLRSCFLPNLSGLHLRIYQFQKLLHQHVPELAAHLDHLQIEGAYLSQWFLSFFATTCPLPMLFRIYDVIFAEGASETIMRVALSIMRRNEKRLFGFTEFEDAMQLLLSRSLWDPYGMSATSADELVNDFCNFTSVVTRESLQALETSFREAQNTESSGALSFLPSVQAAASRFLGRRLWYSSAHTPSKSQSTLSPGATGSGSGSSRPTSAILRSPSKQSLSTLYSTEGSSDSSSSTTSTSVTEMSAVSRESAADYVLLKSAKSHTEVDRSTKSTLSSKDKDLHQQVEDLLMVLSEMQREHSVLAAQLQREREERNEDRLVFKSLVDQLKEEMGPPVPKPERRKTSSDAASTTSQYLSEKARQMVDQVYERITPSKHSRKSSGYETKAQLRINISNMKEQLHIETTRTQELSRQLSEREQEATSAKEELQKARARIKDGHLQQQRLEKTILELRQAQRQQLPSSSSQPSNSTSGSSTPDETTAPPPMFRTDTAPSENVTANKGLREFKLPRALSDRQPQQQRSSHIPSPTSTSTFSKRTSSLAATAIINVEQSSEPQEALLQELVAAKTGEALARQELEELRVRFESMRKAMGITTTASTTSTLTGGQWGHVESGSTTATTTATSGAGSSQAGEERVKSTASERKSKSPDNGGGGQSGSGWSGVTGSFWGWGGGRRTASSSRVAVLD